VVGGHEFPNPCRPTFPTDYSRRGVALSFLGARIVPWPMI
jgi:hypothetical protein